VIVKAKLKKLKEAALQYKKTTQLSLYRDISLMLAMFFLPLGYDMLFRLIMEMTGSYWAADAVFYSISGFFWLVYILLTKHLNKHKND
jgi:hypothetical protein